MGRRVLRGESNLRRSLSPSRIPPVEGTVTVIAKDGQRHTAKFPVERPAPAVKLPGGVLVGVCIYPEEELTADAIAKLEADGKKEWDGHLLVAPA